MEMTDIIQGDGILISGVGLKMLFDFAKSYFAARNQRTEIANDPLKVDKLDKYVTRGEFNKAIERNDAEHKRIEADNAAAHKDIQDEAFRIRENIFSRLTRNDREMGEIKGLLKGLAEDMQLIKGKLFKTRN